MSAEIEIHVGQVWRHDGDDMTFVIESIVLNGPEAWLNIRDEHDVHTHLRADYLELCNLLEDYDFPPADPDDVEPMPYLAPDALMVVSAMAARIRDLQIEMSKIDFQERDYAWALRALNAGKTVVSTWSDYSYQKIGGILLERECHAAHWVSATEISDHEKADTWSPYYSGLNK